MAIVDGSTVLAGAVTEPPGNTILGSVFGLVMVIACSYAAGRIHQWYRTALERDEAWRTGYNLAATALFRHAVNVAGAAIARRPKENEPVTGTATVTRLPVQHPRSEAAERFERTTRRLLRQPRHASTDDEVTTVIKAS